MIDEIKLKFGQQLSSQPLAFKPGGVTVFVGPNNSGKSLILREIETFSRMGPVENRKIIDNIDYILPNKDKVREILLSKSLLPLPNENIREGNILIGKIQLIEGRIDRHEIPLNDLLRLVEEYNKNLNSNLLGVICSNLINLFTIRLDGRTRFSLTDDRPSGDLQRESTSHLMSLFKDEESRITIRNITADAFGLYFTIDPTGMNKFRIRMSLQEPSDSLEEQALDERARAFHANAFEIAELSDGIKAYTGIISALLSSDFKIILIDEPEAFLHPPLIRKLGNYLARIATERKANVFAATHSSDFLMGCVQSGKPVNIIRLTYSGGIATARLLSSEKLQLIMRDPLMRSSGVLSALFHESAIICEADTDRVFYQEINGRLLSFQKGGLDNCIFLNAQNKQTIKNIVGPLREMGISAAAIVDLDIIKKGDELKNLLKNCNVPQELINTWGTLRGESYKLFEKKGLNPKKEGINKLDAKENEIVLSLLSSLAKYGIFVVPNGELEAWLKSLNAKGHGPEWLVDIFEKMGSDPDSGNYVKPGQGDVWDFIKNIAQWIRDPYRLGMS